MRTFLSFWMANRALDASNLSGYLFLWAILLLIIHVFHSFLSPATIFMKSIYEPTLNRFLLFVVEAHVYFLAVDWIVNWSPEFAYEQLME